MKNLVVVAVLVSASAFGKTAEMWKGESPATEFTVGGGAGASFNGTRSLGGIFLLNAAKKIVDRGFVPDINDQVFLEAQGGMELYSFGNNFTGSLALRWDFHKDDDLSLFATGGLGTRLGSSLTQFFPHLSLGVIWHLDVIDIRTELSQNWLVAGISFSF